MNFIQQNRAYERYVEDQEAAREAWELDLDEEDRRARELKKEMDIERLWQEREERRG